LDDDSRAWKTIVANPVKEIPLQQGKKSLFRSVMKKFLTPVQKIMTPTQTRLHENTSI
jgi:hypothetical protein